MSVHNQFTASSGNHSNNSNAGGGGFSISEHVLMAKQEKANGGAYCSETKYSDGFNDFGLFYGSGKPGSASEINGRQKSGDVFMSEPVNGGGLYGSGNDGDSKDSGVAGYDVAGGDDFDFDIDADIDSDIQSEDTLPEDGTVGHTGFFDFFNDFDGRNEPEKKKSDTLFSEQEFGDDVFFDDSAGYGGKEDGEEEHDDQDDESYFDDDEFFEKEFGDKKKNIRMILIICGIAAAVILLLVISINFTISSIIGKGTVYDGVLINGHNLSGMTKDEVAAYVKKTYFDPIAEAKVTIRLGETAETYSLINFVVCPDENEIAEEAYSVARTGKKLDRVNEILELKSNPRSLTMSLKK